MRQLSLGPVLAVLVVTLASSARADTIPWPAKAPIYDHIVIVVEENKDYEQIDKSKAAAFLKTLAASGASFSRMFGEEHNSEGNYFWLFSGDNQGVGWEDAIPTEQLATSNLGQQLIAHPRGDKKMFAGYAENLPAIGSEQKTDPDPCKGDHCIYGRKHVPWISFANLPHGASADTTNLRFADFPQDYTKLPVVAFVIPNLVNDMHNGGKKKQGGVEAQIKAGDDWLKDKLKGYAEWATKNNSLLIVTFDESDKGGKAQGLTDPSSDVTVKRNQIFTIFVGAHIKPGFVEGHPANHVTILRTIEAMYGLPKSGKQQEFAAKAGISDDYIVTDLFDTMP